LGNAILRGRDKGAELALDVQSTACTDKNARANLANSGLFAKNQEISVCGEMGGGPGRTRTSNQAVMSALLYSKKSLTIGVFGPVRRRMFVFGCGVLLVIHWSEANASRKSEIHEIKIPHAFETDSMPAAAGFEPGNGGIKIK
jgi:hypothetical protein